MNVNDYSGLLRLSRGMRSVEFLWVDRVEPVWSVKERDRLPAIKWKKSTTDS